MSQQKCPVCGHDNGATATICAECHSLLGVTTLLNNQTVSDTLRPIDATVIPTRRAVRQVTPLEPDALEDKYYAPGVGNVLTVDLQAGERIKLVRIHPNSE